MKTFLLVAVLLMTACGTAVDIDETAFGYMEGYYEPRPSGYGLQYIDLEEFQLTKNGSFEVHGFVEITKYWMTPEYSATLRFGAWRGIFLPPDYQDGDFVDFHAPLDYKHYFDPESNDGRFEWRPHPIYKTIHMVYDDELLLVIIDYVDPDKGMQAWANVVSWPPR